MLDLKTTLLVGLITTLGLKALGRLLRTTVFVPKLTVSDDIAHLQEPRKGGKLPGQAVVCGGSIAGMQAAAVLSNHYESVLIVEPEAWVATEDGTTLPVAREAKVADAGYPIEVNRRNRVMQSTSIHVLFPVLLNILRQLFPNLDEEADKFGLMKNIGNADLYTHISGAPSLPRPKGQKVHDTLWLSRKTLEQLVRRLLLKSRSNVRWVTGTATAAHRQSDNPKVLDSVTIRFPEGHESIENASLVVDATGPVQAGLKWLERLGAPLDPSLRVQYSPKMYYVTMLFTIPPHVQAKVPVPGGWDARNWIYTYLPDPELDARCCALGIIENSQLLVFCGGWDLVSRPHSPAEVKDVLATLYSVTPVPGYVYDILDVVQEHIEEVNPTYTESKFTNATYIHYHKFAAQAPNFPSNFVALGDSVMTINPIYGQGCSKAAIGAVTLDHVLRRMNPRSDKDFASTFFQKQCDRVGGLWELNKASDYGYSSTTPTQGETLATGALTRWYSKQLLTASLKDATLTWVIWDVRGFLLPATDLFAPSIFASAIWVWITGKSRSKVGSVAR